MQITALYVGSSLLAPLRNAECEIREAHGLDLCVATHNFGAAFSDDEWSAIEDDLRVTDVLFVIHVMDSENATRLLSFLDGAGERYPALIVINCMPELMKRTRLGKLDFERLTGRRSRKGAKAQSNQVAGTKGDDEANATSLLRSIGTWIGRQARGGGDKKNGHGRAQYLKYTNHLPSLLRFIPGAGALRDVKNYLMMFCYFLQPTPSNIRSMLLYSLKHYVDDDRLKKIKIPPPESMPAVAIYHPDAPALFESFESYATWYNPRWHRLQPAIRPERINHRVKPGPLKKSTKLAQKALESGATIGLLLMRPQIVSNARKHYDGLIRAIEAEGLSVIPAISTLMDNREACRRFFIEPHSNVDAKQVTTDNGQPAADKLIQSRVSQIVSLTGFSFVGGPAMNDSEAAAEFLRELNLPFRSMVSLDTQTIESWQESFSGLNPVQTGMQIAIPEIDGATEPFIFGGIPARGVEPAPLDDRCIRIARRLKRWNRLQTAPRDQLKLALTLYCFPPNKGNIGTAADLDVFASLFDMLRRLKEEGYRVDVPESIDALRAMLLGGNSEALGTTANVAYRMNIDEYRRLNPFFNEIETDWGPAPGAINSHDGDLLIQGITIGNIFIGVQPTFGFEDDPMRLLMAKGGTPHHGFTAFYAYLEKVFQADAVVHVGTHGALEFMPGKQVGLSGACWPDRLIGELPNIYIYSVNNPSEGTIAKRRSYAELISYLTPPIENAGLYRGLASLKDLIGDYRRATDAIERGKLFAAIQEQSEDLNLGARTSRPHRGEGATRSSL
ncbi:MAG: magnesium chelatase subunit [Blastocatellia bacterium]|jgi:magnesium chelatase subunit H|nr:magnesium chelatase subunit [Blastocatellia bacterium]